MDEIILKTEKLSKDFGEFKAVNGLSLEVYYGDIYGFLGLNGAGKTTTIRMLLSLIMPSAGNIWFYGKKLSKAHLEIMKSVGAMVEIPAFYTYLSGLDNIKLLARVAGLRVADNYFNKIINEVGLTGRANDKVQAYSQGMRQRLGIAQALLGKIPNNGNQSFYPPIVILDEPTNGLDPQGIVDIRNLIKRLNKNYQITFFISSHLLSEIELLCNRVGIIKQGSLVAQGKIDELVAKTHAGNLRIKAAPVERALELIKQLEWVEFVELNRLTDEINVRCASERVGELNRYLVNNRLMVTEIASSKRLEEYFISLM